MQKQNALTSYAVGYRWVLSLVKAHKSYIYLSKKFATVMANFAEILVLTGYE